MDDRRKVNATELLATHSAIKTALFWISLLILTGMGSLAFLFFREESVKELIALGISAAIILLALAFNRKDKTQRAGLIIALVLTTMITMLATIGQGIYDIAVMAYPATLIIASFVLRRNTTTYLTAFLITCVGWLIFGNIYGLYQPAFPNQSYARQFFIVSLILIITAIAVQFLSEAIRNSAIAARHELAERIKTEAALEEAKELYRNMVEETSVITYRDTAEKESSTLYISPQIEKVLGYSQAEWQKNPKIWIELTHPEDLPGVLATIEKYLETSEKAVSEYRMLSKDGKWIWFQDESVVIKNEHGKPQYIHGVLIDITERKQAELKIKQREAILSAVAYTAQQLLKTSNWRDEINVILKLLGEATGASHVYIFENHPDAKGIMVASQRYEWTAPGIKPELDNPVYQNTIISPIPGIEDWHTNLSTGKHFYGSREQYPKYWEKAFDERGLKTLLDMPVYVNDQWWGIIGFDDFVNERPWSQAEVDALIAAAGNLGAAISRQKADTALRASDVKFQLAFHQTFVPMIISKASDHTILDANQAFCKGTGYSRAEVLGHSGTDLNLWVNPEEQRHHHQLITEHGSVEELRTEFRRKSGELGIALISTVTIHLDDEPCLLYTLYDISKIEELLTELKAKNEELQNFTYTVSHDLRAPLITISGFLGYLEQDAAKGDLNRVQRDALRINEAVSKMQRLLSELLELSRIGRLMNPPENIAFGEIVQEALRLVEGRLKAKQVTVKVDTDFPTVYGDRTRLIEVIQNLVDNAAKFTGVQKKPEINIGVKFENNKPIFFVRDNGIGIEPEQQEKVFGLFNKLDANTEGTGIGLALVKRIVEVHGGKIWIESAGKEHGTTFYFTLSGLPTQ